MRLLCNGVALDLVSGAQMFFKKVNPLFAFDNVSCERTQAFDLPDTPRNNRVLGLAKVPAFYGEGMRRRFAAELQDGAVVKTGYLFVGSYEGKYKAVFVTGELFNLKKLQDLGNVSDIIAPDNFVPYGDAPQPAPVLAADGWATVMYEERNGATQYPSVRVKYIIDKVCEKYNLPPIFVPSGTEYLRLIPTKLNRPKERDGVLWSEEGGVRIDEAFTNMLEPAFVQAQDFSVVAVPVGGGYHEPQINYGELKDVPAFRALHNLVLSFDTDAPSDLYIRTGSNPTATGNLVAGRQFYIPSGEVFFLYYAGDVDSEQGTTPYYEPDGAIFYEESVQWTFAFSAHFYTQSCTLGIQGAGDWQTGEEVFLQDNLPDVSVVDLLKMVAAVSGTVLNYTDEDGITFDVVNFDDWDTIDKTYQVIKTTSVKRTFADYARENVVAFDSGDWVLIRERERYIVDNENLDESKTLLEIPFSEGDALPDDLQGVVVVDTEEADGAFVLAGVTDGVDRLTRVRLRKNAGVQHLCDESTCVSMQVRMTLHEYERMRAKVLLLIRGTRYVWTEANWSKGVATLTLSKV